MKCSPTAQPAPKAERDQSAFNPPRAGDTTESVSQRVTLPREIWVLVAAAVVVSLGYGIVAPVLPQFAKSFGVTTAAATVVVSAFAFMRLAFAPASGKLSTMFGERWMYVLGMAIVATSSVASGLAQNYWQLLVFRGLGGIGSVTFSVAAMSLIFKLAPTGGKGRASAAYGSGFLIGNIFGPAVGAMIAPLGYRWPFMIYAVLLGVGGLIVFLMVPANTANTATHSLAFWRGRRSEEHEPELIAGGGGLDGIGKSGGIGGSGKSGGVDGAGKAGGAGGAASADDTGGAHGAGKAASAADTRGVDGAGKAAGADDEDEVGGAAGATNAADAGRADGTAVSKPETDPAKIPMTIGEALQIRRFKIVLLTAFAQGWTNLGVRVAVVPLLAASIPEGPSWLPGAALMVFAAGNGLALSRTGYFSDIYGRKPIVVVGLIISGVFTVMMGMWNTTAVVLLGSFFGGFGSGSIQPSQQGTVADIVGNRPGSQVVSFFQQAGDFGQILGPIVAGLMIDYSGYGLAYGISGSILLAVAAAWIFLVREKPGKQS